MKNSVQTKSSILILILCYLVFFEFITISTKEITGLEFIGALRDALLIGIAYFCIYKHKRTSIHLYLIVLISYGASLWDSDARPFANLVSAFIIGCTIKAEAHPYKTVIVLLIVICASSIIYQSFHITDFEQFWFYNYLLNKEGDLFLATQYAYFRGNVRPTGPMISPSVMGLALIGLGYIYKIGLKPRKTPYFVYAIILICLQLIQTRALIIGFIFYVFIEINIKRVNSKTIALLYLLATVLVFFTIIYFGDDSAYVRALLLYSVFDYLSNGILLPHFQVDQPIIVDSQLVGFFYLTGPLGVMLLWAFYSKAKKIAKSHSELVSFNLFSLCLFVSIFQWSYDSFGLLVGCYSLGTIFRKSRPPQVILGTPQLSTPH